MTDASAGGMGDNTQVSVPKNDKSPPGASIDSRLQMSYELIVCERSAQMKSLEDLRSRSLGLFEMLLIGTSIAFAVGIRGNNPLPAWAVACIVVALAASLLVTCYISWSKSLYIAPGNERLLESLDKGSDINECIRVIIKQSAVGTTENTKVLKPRHAAFKGLLAFLLIDFFVALIVFLARL
jgi:hypothetical protein